MRTPNDIFGRDVRVPGDFSREGRIALLAHAFDALLAGQLPSREACAFLGAAGSAWLREGGRCGSLERDFLQVVPPRRSTKTPARTWREMQDTHGSTCRGTAEAEVDTIPDINDKSSSTS